MLKATDRLCAFESQYNYFEHFTKTSCPLIGRKRRMCGIVGYIGNQDSKEILLKGLEKLEYRGYDSAGIAVMNEEWSSCF